MSRFQTIAMAASAALFLSLGACQSGGTNLVQQWRAECAAAGFGSRTTGLAACVAKKRSDYESDSLSVPANL